MKTIAVFLSFAFVAEVFGQTYVGRPLPDIKKVVPFGNPMVGPLTGPIGMSGGLMGLQGGGVLPPHIQSLIGSTLNGEEFIGGVRGLPRHGGAGIGEAFADGLRNGWGADPNMPVVQAVSSWVDPLEGRAFPHDYTGGELFFDNALGQYVARQQHDMAKSVGAVPVGGPVGHNIAKAQVHHDAAKMSGAVGPMMPGQMQHDIAKATSGMSLGPVVDPMRHNMAKAEIQHDMAKASSGMMMPVDPLYPTGSNPINHNIAKAEMQHDIAKASGGVPPMGNPIFGGVHSPVVAGQIQHDMAKASSGMGHMGMVNPAVQHNIAKAEVQHDMAKASGGMMMPVDPLYPTGSNPINHNIAKAEMQHDIAKASGGVPPMGNPIFGGVHSPVVAGQIQHDMAKASSGMGHMGMVNPAVQHDIAKASAGIGMIGGGAIDPFGHNVVKASSGINVMDPLNPVGMGMGSISAGKPIFNNPVHNVDKAGASGIPAIGHDPLAAQIGHGIAKQTIRETAQIVDMGSGGALSMGNPLAASATHGLAKEAVHVAGKTLNVASGGVPSVSATSIKRITGYQGRQRNPVPPPVMKQW